MNINDTTKRNTLNSRTSMSSKQQQAKQNLNSSLSRSSRIFMKNNENSSSDDENQSKFRPLPIRQLSQSSQSTGFRQTCLNIFRPSYKQQTEQNNRVVILTFDEATKILEEQANMNMKQRIIRKFDKKRASTVIQPTYERKFDFDFLPIQEQQNDEQIEPMKGISTIERKQEETMFDEKEQSQQKVVASLSRQLNQLILGYEEKQKEGQSTSMSEKKIMSEQVESLKAEEREQIKFVSILESMKVPLITKRSEMQILIGSCFLVLESDPAPTKIKYEINLATLVLRNSTQIFFSNIQKIKVFGGQNRTFILKINLKEKVKLYTDEKSKTSIIYLLDYYENIYTIFSSILVRKVLENSQSQFASMLDSGPTTGKSNTLAVTSYFLGRDSKEFKNNQLFKHLIKDSAIGQNFELDGMINKRSRHIKKWSKRFVRISKNQLFTYQPEAVELYDEKKEKNNKTSSKMKLIKPTTEANNIEELWTRFEYVKINNQKCLILKTHHIDREKIKTEFGIPIMNYANIFQEGNWLYGFYSLLRTEQ